MKRILLFAFGLAVFAMGKAAIPELSINGVKAERVPVSISFDGDNLILDFGDATESHDMESVVIDFKNSSDIENLSAMQFTGFIGDILILDGVADGVVLVYNPQGILCAEGIAVGGHAEINTSALAGGMYLLKAGSTCVKFVKR